MSAPIDRYCTQDCEFCPHRQPDGRCVFEYRAADYGSGLQWMGDGPPPAHWWAGGIKVYRSFADYCDD